MGFRKPRSDSKLKSLPFDKKQQIADWLTGGLAYHKVLELLEKEPFYIETSDRALSEFYQDFCLPQLVERNQRASRLATSFYKQAKKQEADFDGATIEELSRLCFDLARTVKLSDQKNASKNLHGVKVLMTLLLKRRDQDEKAKSRELAYDKFKAGMMKKIDLGLQELFDQIKDIPAALAAFDKMKAAVKEKETSK